ncbi:hypothetical protein [Streptomyces acidicola]|uniref:hypothetical protein n=1 Tax=Streptomyces acidicola TaxID=2596892 RepID=UPI0037FF7859
MIHGTQPGPRRTETLRAELNTATAREPEWLAGFRLSGSTATRSGSRTHGCPRGKTKQGELIEQIGADGLSLLAALYGPGFEVVLIVQQSR